MQPLTGKEVFQRIHGLIQAKYQVHHYSVDLTVHQVYSVDPVGQVDFGGSEFTPAGRIPVATRRRRREDKYAWWDLGRGAYFIEFNEALELAEDEIALLEPDYRLLRAGATHVPVFLRGSVSPIETLLRVDGLRLQIKQNARTSHVRLFRFLPAEKLLAALTSPRKRAKPKRKTRSR